MLFAILELMLLGGIDVIVVTCNHVNHLIRLNGDVPSLRNLIGENVGNEIEIIYNIHKIMFVYFTF